MEPIEKVELYDDADFLENIKLLANCQNETITRLNEISEIMNENRPKHVTPAIMDEMVRGKWTLNDKKVTTEMATAKVYETPKRFKAEDITVFGYSLHFESKKEAQDALEALLNL